MGKKCMNNNNFIRIENLSYFIDEFIKSCKIILLLIFPIAKYYRQVEIKNIIN